MLTPTDKGLKVDIFRQGRKAECWVNWYTGLPHREGANAKAAVTQDLEACRAKSFKTFLTASNPSATLTLSAPIKGTNERIDSDAKQENRWLVPWRAPGAWTGAARGSLGCGRGFCGHITNG